MTPSITILNRLLPRTRSTDGVRSLRAEVRDGLWMLGRQWQMGEFEGDDAATLTSVRVHSWQTTFAGTSNTTLPLDTEVEQEAVPNSLFLQVQAGAYFIKLLRNKNASKYLNVILAHFPLEKNTLKEWDSEALELFTGTNGKIPDGCKILGYQSNSTQKKWSEWIESGEVQATDKTILQDIHSAFRAWFERTYRQNMSPLPKPITQTAWQKESLNYKVEKKSGDILLQCSTYEGQNLDWQHFDLVQGSIPSLPTNQRGFLPAPVRFKGMPHPRYWQMEEGAVNFGQLQHSATGVLTMAFAEFGLSYSNDWFYVPFSLKVNTLCRINRIEVFDNFSTSSSFIENSVSPELNPLRRFTMYATQRPGSDESLGILYFPPVSTKILQGEPIESVRFLRDEMANMVWAVETRLPSNTGQGIDTKRMTSPNATNAVKANAANRLNYKVGTLPPRQWVPFIPVKRDSRLMLQRARFPGSQPPEGILLTEHKPTWSINEEIVTRAGIIVERKWKRTRWLNGKVVTWLGRRTSTGLGEGSAGLQWDTVMPTSVEAI
jgi:hypothetical protein